MTDRRERAAAADLEARRAAIEVWDRPLLVEAGAGSGKTAVLVARLVAWMVGPGWELAAADQGPGAGDDAIAKRCFDGVVAVTFTEAAAAEMAERTRGAFELLVAGSLPVGMAAAPADGLGRARALLAHCRALQATTIHAFAARLLRDHAFEAGLHPGWRIDADGSTWRQLVAEAAEVELVALWADGAASVRVLAAAGLGPSEVAQVVLALAEEGVSAEWVKGQADLSAERVVQSMAAAVEALVATARGPLARAGRSRARLRMAGALLFRLADVAARLVESSSLAPAIAGRFEPNLLRRLGEWGEGRFTQAEAAVFADVSEQLATQASRVRRLILHLARCRFEQFAAAAVAVAAVLERAELEARRRGVVRFADLVPLAGRLLRRAPAVGSGLRSRLRQMLVDEVQDTDQEQLELISQLAFDGSQGGPGLFLVGDPKQSIYGWRSADLAAYDELGARIERAGGRVLRLVANFRSLPPILEAVERWVEPVMVREPGIQPRFEPLLPRRRLPSSALGEEVVERWRIDPGCRSLVATEIEADAIARELAESIAAGMAPESAAILLRTTGDLPVYLEALRRRGVPYAVARERGWRRRREVVEAAAVLRVLLDPADHLALAAVLRSALIGVPDGALEPLWQIGLPQAFSRVEEDGAAVGGVVQQVPGEWDRVGSGWRRAVTAFAEQVGALRRGLQELPSDVWMRRLREELAIEALELGRPLGAWRCEGVRRLFEVVRQALARGQAPLEVAASLRSKRADVDEEGEISLEPNLVPGAVRVMTVHAAKGLDFDQVYVAQLHKEPAMRRRQRATSVLVDETGTRHLVLAGWPAPDAWRGEEATQRVAAAEQVRLFYVALTRARERLVLVGRAAQSGRTKPLSFADLLAGDPVEQGLGETLVRVVELTRQPGAAPEVRSAPPPLVAPVRLHQARSRTDLPYVAIPSTDEEGSAFHRGDDPERAKAVGRVVHRALEVVDLDLDAAALARQLSELVASFARHEDEEVERLALDVVEAFAGGPLWDRWVGSKHRIRARELPFVSPGGDDLAAGAVVGVLDCVLAPEQADGPWLVVDYKTDRLDAGESPTLHAERYRLQGEAYAAALDSGLGLAVSSRVEWWFLREGLVVELPSGPGTR